MDSSFAFRALLLLWGLGLLSILLVACRRGLTPGFRLAMDYALGLYALTFFLGVALLFLWQDSLIDLYFGGAYAAPRDTPFDWLLALASMPLLVMPALLWSWQKLAASTLPGSDFSNSSDRRVQQFDNLALVLGVGSTLIGTLLLVGHLLPTLFENALTGFASTASLVDLYSRRAELFASLSALQAGLLYGTLPTCAALLMFVPIGPAPVLRVAGGLVCMAALLANAGLFQIGPLLAFGLSIALCAAMRLKGGIKLSRVAGLLVIGGAVFGVYESIKNTGGETHFPGLQLALRLPIALPYLWEFSSVAPAELAASDSLPHDLGEFMFPELRGPERFIAMPQPGFIEAHFQYGLLAGISVIIALTFIAGLAGTVLDRMRTRHDRQGPVLLAVLMAPTLYYGFQVQLKDVLLSSYGLLFPALPVIAMLLARSLTARPISPTSPLFTISSPTS